MRYQSARVVLGACLIAATSAAQAPASSSAPSSTRGNELHRSSADDLRFPRSALLDDVTGALQQDPDYTLRGMFRINHGEFMDRRERYRPEIDLRARLMPNQRINDEPGSFDMLGYDVDGAVKALVSTDGYLTFGGYFLGRRYLTSSAFGTGGNVTGIGDETLIGAGARIGFGVFLDDNTLLEMETRPGVWSDIDDTLHHEDFDFPSSGMLTFRAFDNNFFFKIGARYNQVYEEAPWLPILGFSWEVVDGFRIDILAPESAELSWWPSDSVGVLFGAEVTGAEYHVHTPESINQRDDLRVQEVVSYLGLMTRMNDHASLLVRAGIVVAGDYDMTNGTAGFNRAEGALDQGFWAEVSFGVSF